jgi:two-component system response regulator HydG
MSMSTNHRILLVHAEASVRGLLASMLQTLGCRLEEAPNDRAAVRLLEQGGVNLVVAVAEPDDPEILDLLAYVRRKALGTGVVVLFSAPCPDKCREATQWGAAAVLRFPLPATHLRAAVAQALGVSEPAETTGSSSSRGHASTSTSFSPAAGQGFLASSPPTPAMAPQPVLSARVEPGAMAPDLGSASNGNGNGNAPSIPNLIGEDHKLRQAIELATSIAPTPAPALIVGERGTGKSLMARTLHRRSPRSNGPFLTLDASALDDSRQEIELFGRTGPPGITETPGRIEMASGGTLVIEEIGSLAPALQLKLLRVIQDGEYEPVGSHQTRRADVRFLFTSRQDILSLVESGRFRSDLYYRMSVVTLSLPPLRFRGEDIDRLADHFRARIARALGRPVAGFSLEAIDLLRRHPWPDNVMELEAIVERAVVICSGPRIEASHLDLNRPMAISPRNGLASHASPATSGNGHTTTPGHGNGNGQIGRSRSAPPAMIQPLKEALEGPERELILQALQALNWNRQETARKLDINRTTLYKKMKKYGLLYDEPAWAN